MPHRDTPRGQRPPVCWRRAECLRETHCRASFHGSRSPVRGEGGGERWWMVCFAVQFRGERETVTHIARRARNAAEPRERRVVAAGRGGPGHGGAGTRREGNRASRGREAQRHAIEHQLPTNKVPPWLQEAVSFMKIKRRECLDETHRSVRGERARDYIFLKDGAMGASKTNRRAIDAPRGLRGPVINRMHAFMDGAEAGSKRTPRVWKRVVSLPTSVRHGARDAVSGTGPSQLSPSSKDMVAPRHSKRPVAAARAVSRATTATTPNTPTAIFAC
jgi:hypothetical protein